MIRNIKRCPEGHTRINGRCSQYRKGGLVNRNQEQNHLSTGGHIPYYTGTTQYDTVPAMLTEGEFVLTKEATEKYGTDFLYRLNSGQVNNSVRYLQEGGEVQTSSQVRTGLWTNGGEYVCETPSNYPGCGMGENGTYKGSMHFHPDKGYMAGANHSAQEHPRLMTLNREMETTNQGNPQGYQNGGIVTNNRTSNGRNDMARINPARPTLEQCRKWNNKIIYQGRNTCKDVLQSNTTRRGRGRQQNSPPPNGNNGNNGQTMGGSRMGRMAGRAASAGASAGGAAGSTAGYRRGGRVTRPRAGYRQGGVVGRRVGSSPRPKPVRQTRRRRGVTRTRRR